MPDPDPDRRRVVVGLDRTWRIVATGISFASFGIGGLLLRFVVLPVVAWTAPSPEHRTVRVRRVISTCFRWFIGWMRWLGVLTYQVDGAERLQRRGLLVLANHPTLLDVVFLVALVPNANCVVKSSLARNPFMRGPVLAADFIFNDEGPGLVQECIASLEAGSNLILFPEGTRTPRDSPLGRFQRGASNIAVRGRRGVTPVAIRCEPPTLKKGQNWYNVPLRRMHFTLRVLPDIRPEDRDAAASEALLAREHARRLRDLFLEELRCARTGNQAADHFGAES